MSKKIVIAIIVILIIILAGAGGVWGYGTYINHGINTSVSDNDAEKPFVVNKGDTTNQIAKNLKEAELIKKEVFFEKYVERENLTEKLQAGEYLLKATMTPKEIADNIASGKTGEPQITIPEGWKAEEIAKDLAQEGIVTEKEFMNIVEKVNFDYDFLKDRAEGASLEGYLFPDTYRIGQETNSRKIITKMLENFDNKLSNKLRADIQSQDKTIFEIITMASLIEKEVSEEKDRPTVAGIFYNRLDINQALESCATIQYILGSNKKRFSYEETRTESPYNTYTNIGLPPGPICNPGLPAIKAAIYPEDSNYLYFLSDNQGKTHYATSGEEHEANKTKYLK
ncbi:endolytic transglycosylase MltG [Patescibacteria group bacterium]